MLDREYVDYVHKILFGLQTTTALINYYENPAGVSESGKGKLPILKVTREKLYEKLAKVSKGES